MRPVLGTSVIRVFELTAASTGLTQQQCRVADRECRAIYVRAAGHASYYPGADAMTLKLVYTPQGKLLGGQAVGGKGVDKRIDVIATAIAFGASVWDLAGLDLAYAPPYGSAKDPIHMAAFVACNDLRQAPSVVPPDAELEPFQVVDVRNPAELKRLPLPGAIAIPLDQLAGRIEELDATRPTITVCHSGKRAHVAASQLKSRGFLNVANLTGGMMVRNQIAAMKSHAAERQNGRNPASRT